MDSSTQNKELIAALTSIALAILGNQSSRGIVLAAIPNSISSGAVVTSYTVNVDDGNFSSGVWTAPEACDILVTFSASYLNQATGGGRLDFTIQKNGSDHSRFWSVGRPGNTVDDVSATQTIPISVAKGDTIRVYNIIVENAGSFQSSISHFDIVRLT